MFSTIFLDKMKKENCCSWIQIGFSVEMQSKRKYSIHSIDAYYMESKICNDFKQWADEWATKIW